MSRYTAQDKKLLESGLFADVTVKCKDKEWKLHKIILCARSEWFRKALCGKFSEATTNLIALQNQEPAIVDIVIKWIYVGILDLESLPQQTDKCLLALVELYLAADFFHLNDLKGSALRKLDRNLARTAVYIQRRFCNNNAPPRFLGAGQLDNDYLEADTIYQLLPSVKRAYESPFAELQSCFSSFVSLTHCWVMKDSKFQQLMFLVPSFGKDALQGLSNICWPSRTNVGYCPERCHDCGRSWPDNDAGWHYALVWRRDADFLGRCVRCVEMMAGNSTP